MNKRIYIKWLSAMLLFLMLTVLFCAGILASEHEQTCKPYNWYVHRNSECKQPCADAEQKKIEKYNGYYVDKQHGDDTEDRVLYLTFDAGYENGNVSKILDILKKENIPAAFFVLENMLRKEMPVVERMRNEGHLVCNHTMRHKDTTQLSKEEFCAELDGLASLYKQCFGSDMALYYRPPEGKYNEKTLQYASAMGYKTVFWSLAYADWDNERQPAPQKAKETILNNTHNGAVILLHPTSSTNVKILTDLISEWRAKGYRFGTLDELTNNALATEK